MTAQLLLSTAFSAALTAFSNPNVVALADSAGDENVSVIAQWGEQLDLDERIVEQIDRYSREEDDLGDSYAPVIAAAVRRLVFQDAVYALGNLPDVGGEPSVEVTYLKSGFAVPDGKEPDDDHQRGFEEGYIRIEVVARFEIQGLTPEQALRAYTSPEFRMSTSSRIKRIWADGDLSCIEVKGVRALLSPTLACNRIDEFIRPGLASQHSQVVSNPGGDDYQTVYYKESLKTFVAVPNGLALHYINYTRAVKLGSLKKSLGRGRIVDSEEEKIQELKTRFANGIK
jgi:hypothetical protein